eukprot:677125_1
MQILDKIHCHYLHCYDIGHRLTPREKHTTFNDNDIDDEQQFKELATLISSRRKTFETVYQSLGRITSSSKFVSSIENREDDMKTDGFNDLQFYDFGVVFCYRMMQPKFRSIKHELTNNKFVTVSLQEFNLELAKAERYFNCEYCQKTLVLQSKEFSHYRPAEHVVIGSQHILAVLIYCNYDELQREFSKTYRAIYKNESEQSIEDRHSQYYFLGKYLKEAVH